MKTRAELLAQLKQDFKESKSITITSISNLLFGDDICVVGEDYQIYVGDLLIFQFLLQKRKLQATILEFSNGSKYQGCVLHNEFFTIIELTDDRIHLYHVNEDAEVGHIGYIENPIRPVTGYMEVIELFQSPYEQWVLEIDEHSHYGVSELMEDYIPNILSRSKLEIRYVH